MKNMTITSCCCTFGCRVAGERLLQRAQCALDRVSCEQTVTHMVLAMVVVVAMVAVVVAVVVVVVVAALM